LAQLEIRGKQFQSVKRLIGEVQKRFPKSNMSDVIQGDLYFVQADYESSLGAYQKASVKADSSTLVLKRHSVLRKLNNKNQAVKLLQSWLTKHPDDYHMRTTLALDYQDLGKNSLAINEYKKVLGAQSDNASVLNNLAWLLHEEGDKKALEYAQKAYDLAPRQGAIADTLGWLYLQNGQNQQGLEILKSAVEKAPNVPDIRYHYAVALHKNGKRDLAKKELLSLLKTHESFSTRQAANSLLNQLR
jgi:Tfp pilus assembly protein PilF